MSRCRGRFRRLVVGIRLLSASRRIGQTGLAQGKKKDWNGVETGGEEDEDGVERRRKTGVEQHWRDRGHGMGMGMGEESRAREAERGAGLAAHSSVLVAVVGSGQWVQTGLLAGTVERMEGSLKVPCYVQGTKVGRRSEELQTPGKTGYHFCYGKWMCRMVPVLSRRPSSRALHGQLAQLSTTAAFITTRYFVRATEYGVLVNHKSSSTTQPQSGGCQCCQCSLSVVGSTGTPGSPPSTHDVPATWHRAPCGFCLHQSTLSRAPTADRVLLECGVPDPGLMSGWIGRTCRNARSS